MPELFLPLESRGEEGSSMTRFAVLGLGAVVAALNISAHAMRANKNEIVRNYLPVLRKAGDRIGGLA